MWSYMYSMQTEAKGFNICADELGREWARPQRITLSDEKGLSHILGKRPLWR
jgi:hypothetical protein